MYMYMYMYHLVIIILLSTGVSVPAYGGGPTATPGARPLLPLWRCEPLPCPVCAVDGSLYGSAMTYLYMYMYMGLIGHPRSLWALIFISRTFGMYM